MLINVFPVLLSPQNVFVTSLQVMSSKLFRQQLLVKEAKIKKSKMIQFLAALSTLYYQILRVLQRKLNKTNQEG